MIAIPRLLASKPSLDYSYCDPFHPFCIFFYFDIDVRGYLVAEFRTNSN